MNPHRAWGELVSLVALPEDGYVVGQRQSLRDVKRDSRCIFVDVEKPHVDVELSLELVPELIQRVDAFELRWSKAPAVFGASEMGLGIEREDMSVRVSWSATWSYRGPDALAEFHEWVFAQVSV